MNFLYPEKAHPKKISNYQNNQQFVTFIEHPFFATKKFGKESALCFDDIMLLFIINELGFFKAAIVIEDYNIDRFIYSRCCYS